MENNVKKKFCYKKYASLNKVTKKFTCRVETCRKELSAKCASNLRRHYKLVHNQEIGEAKPHREDVKKKATLIKLHTDLNKENFLRCCIGLVAKQNVPLRLFDDKEFFKELIKPYEEEFDTTINSKKILAMLGDSSQQIKTAISEIIKNKMICLKLDVASWQDKNILGVSIQYINNWKICVNSIGMIQLKEGHTAQYLKEEIMKCLEEFHIEIRHIYSNTTDNGANAVKVSKLLQELQEENFTATDEETYVTTILYEEIEAQLSAVFPVVRCAAHTIQLAANDVISTLEVEIEAVREISKKLRVILRSQNKYISLPCLDTPTRWHSTYDMLDSVLSLKEHINELKDSENICVNWIFVEDFVAAFKPLSDCTKGMQKEQYIPGDFFRDWLKCELDLMDMIQTNSNALALHNAMDIRKTQLLQHDAFVAALYLDPRFNFAGTPLLTYEQKQTAMNHLVKTFDIMNYVPKVKTENSTSPFDNLCTAENIPSTSKTAYSKLAQHINQLVSTSNLTTSLNHLIKQELFSLCERQMEPLDIDVLEYWKGSSRNYLHLAELVKVVLAVPATQVSVERAFSALSTMLTMRSQLSNKSISNIIITNLNFDLLDCSALK